MNPTALVQLALLALQAVLNVINEIKGQGGLTDDQILAEAQKITAGNDALYATLVAALQPPVTLPTGTNTPIAAPPQTPPQS